MVDISRHLDFLGPCGKTLSVSERSGLQVSMMQREREERLEGKMVFWGKVEGNENDYLVCYALATPTLEEGDFPLKKARTPCSFYFCVSSDTSLRLMPAVKPEYEVLAAAVTGRLRGDPSLPLDEEPEEEEPPAGEDEEEELRPPERFLEMHRLAFIVKTIDWAVAVVPKGALLVEASRKIRPHRNFEGLSVEAAKDLRNYFHFRNPESIEAIAALTKKGLVRDADFLDPIAADKPPGCWTLSMNPSASCSILRSLAWPGYFFFHEAETGDYGGAYFGDGLPNTDLQFML
ncbi:unnamed protein product [Ectocarpus sp. 13 AM-2016]